MTICPVCRIRSTRGLGWFPPHLPINERRHVSACSRTCLEIVVKYQGNVPELTADEIQAIQEAAVDAGEYLDALGKTNLATMDENEWMEFIECICIGFAETIRARLASDEVPF